MCGENAGYGGNCVSEHDKANLWRLHLEVLLLVMTGVKLIIFSSFQEQHMGLFQRVLPSSKYLKYYRHSSSFSDFLLSQWLQFDISVQE